MIMEQLKGKVAALPIPARVRGFFVILGQAVFSFSRHDGPIMAGYLAFLGLLSLFPFLIFMVSIAGAFGQSATGQAAIEQLLQLMPPEVSAVMEGPIREVVDRETGRLLSVSLAIALWTAASGMEAARAAVRRAYSRRAIKPLWSRRLESLGLVALAALLILLGMFVQVAGPAIWSAVDSRIALPGFVNELWAFARFAVSPIAMFLALYGLYFTLSPRQLTPRYRLPGTFTALSIWLGTATGLSYYLTHFANYDVTYGSLAGVMITLLFFFVVGMGFIFGAEVNAAMTRRAHKRGGDQGDAPP